MTTTTRLSWHRLEAGHYKALSNRGLGRLGDTLRVRLIDGNWLLFVNDDFKGYFGRKADAEERAAELIKGTRS